MRKTVKSRRPNYDRFEKIYELEEKMSINDGDTEADGLYDLSDEELEQMLDIL